MALATRIISGSRGKWTLPAAAILAVAMAGCGRDGQMPADLNAGDANAASSETGAPVVLAPPAPLPPLDRRELLGAASAAADSFADNGSLPASNKALLGRSFEIRLPIGCDGPSQVQSSEWAGWSYNPKSQALKLSARSEITAETPGIPEIAASTAFDAVEGFWIPRPWTSSERCPRKPDGSRAAAVDTGPQDPERGPAPSQLAASLRQTLGIAQFFSPDSPRTLRRGTRPYAVTIKADQPIANGARAYRLAVSGRIAGFADGQPVHCWEEMPNLRPVCVIAVELSRVAFEDPEGGTVLSEWRN